MNVRRIALLFVLGLLCGCGGPKELRPLAPGAVVLAFGDSLTSGVGAETEESYPAVLGSLLGCEVVNAGVPGEITEEGLDRLPHLLQRHRPGLVILCHGGNDMLRRRDDASIVRNLRTLIETAQASGADVVLLGVPRPGIFLKAPDFYGALADEYRLPYDGKTLPKILSSPGLKSDALHPDAEGYRKLAEQVAALIAKHTS